MNPVVPARNRTIADFEGPRSARLEERNRVLNLVNSIFRPQHQSLQEEFPLLYSPSNIHNLLIILDGGQPVCHWGMTPGRIEVLGVSLSVMSVGGVCTAHACRGKGLAAQLLRFAETIYPSENIDLVLISGARRLYTENGCGKAGKSLVFKLTPAAGLKTQTDRDRQVRPYTPQDLDAVCRLYEAEPVRFCRSQSEFELLLRGRLHRPPPDRLMVVRTQDKIVAYFDVGVSVDLSTWEVWEYAGHRDAVLWGLRRSLTALGIENLAFPVIPFDLAMIQQLEALGLATEVHSMLVHSMKVIDFGRFMEKLRPVFETRFGRERMADFHFETRGTGGRLCWKDETLDVPDSVMLAKVLFSSKEGEEESVRTSCKGVIRDFLDTVLPLPLPWPGLNYV